MSVDGNGTFKDLTEPYHIVDQMGERMVMVPSRMEKVSSRIKTAEAERAPPLLGSRAGRFVPMDRAVDLLEKAPESPLKVKPPKSPEHRLSHLLGKTAAKRSGFGLSTLDSFSRDTDAAAEHLRASLKNNQDVLSDLRSRVEVLEVKSAKLSKGAESDKIDANKRELYGRIDSLTSERKVLQAELLSVRSVDAVERKDYKVAQRMLETAERILPENKEFDPLRNEIQSDLKSAKKERSRSKVAEGLSSLTDKREQLSDLQIEGRLELQKSHIEFEVIPRLEKAKELRGKIEKATDVQRKTYESQLKELLDQVKNESFELEVLFETVRVQEILEKKKGRAFDYKTDQITNTMMALDVISKAQKGEKSRMASILSAGGGKTFLTTPAVAIMTKMMAERGQLKTDVILSTSTDVNVRDMTDKLDVIIREVGEYKDITLYKTLDKDSRADALKANTLKIGNYSDLLDMAHDKHFDRNRDKKKKRSVVIGDEGAAAMLSPGLYRSERGNRGRELVKDGTPEEIAKFTREYEFVDTLGQVYRSFLAEKGFDAENNVFQFLRNKRSKDAGNAQAGTYELLNKDHEKTLLDRMGVKLNEHIANGGKRLDRNGLLEFVNAYNKLTFHQRRGAQIKEKSDGSYDLLDSYGRVLENVVFGGKKGVRNYLGEVFTAGRNGDLSKFKDKDYIDRLGSYIDARESDQSNAVNFSQMLDKVDSFYIFSATMDAVRGQLDALKTDIYSVTKEYSLADLGGYGNLAKDQFNGTFKLKLTATDKYGSEARVENVMESFIASVRETVTPAKGEQGKAKYDTHILNMSESVRHEMEGLKKSDQELLHTTIQTAFKDASSKWGTKLRDALKESNQKLEEYETFLVDPDPNSTLSRKNIENTIKNRAEKGKKTVVILQVFDAWSVPAVQGKRAKQIIGYISETANIKQAAQRGALLKDIKGDRMDMDVELTVTREDSNLLDFEASKVDYVTNRIKEIDTKLNKNDLSDSKRQSLEREKDVLEKESFYLVEEIGNRMETDSDFSGLAQLYEKGSLRESKTREDAFKATSESMEKNRDKLAQNYMEQTQNDQVMRFHRSGKAFEILQASSMEGGKAQQIQTVQTIVANEQGLEGLTMNRLMSVSVQNLNNALDAGGFEDEEIQETIQMVRQMQNFHRLQGALARIPYAVQNQVAEAIRQGNVEHTAKAIHEASKAKNINLTKEQTNAMAKVMVDENFDDSAQTLSKLYFSAPEMKVRNVLSQGILKRVSHNYTNLGLLSSEDVKVAANTLLAIRNNADTFESMDSLQDTFENAGLSKNQIHTALSTEVVNQVLGIQHRRTDYHYGLLGKRILLDREKVQDQIREVAQKINEQRVAKDDDKNDPESEEYQPHIKVRVESDELDAVADIFVNLKSTDYHSRESFETAIKDQATKQKLDMNIVRQVMHSNDIEKIAKADIERIKQPSVYSQYQTVQALLDSETLDSQMQTSLKRVLAERVEGQLTRRYGDTSLNIGGAMVKEGEKLLHHANIIVDTATGKQVAVIKQEQVGRLDRDFRIINYKNKRYDLNENDEYVRHDAKVDFFIKDDIVSLPGVMRIFSEVDENGQPHTKTKLALSKKEKTFQINDKYTYRDHQIYRTATNEVVMTEADIKQTLKFKAKGIDLEEDNTHLRNSFQLKPEDESEEAKHNALRLVEGLASKDPIALRAQERLEKLTQDVFGDEVTIERDGINLRIRSATKNSTNKFNQKLRIMADKYDVEDRPYELVVAPLEELTGAGLHTDEGIRLGIRAYLQEIIGHITTDGASIYDHEMDHKREKFGVQMGYATFFSGRLTNNSDKHHPTASKRTEYGRAGSDWTIGESTSHIIEYRGDEGKFTQGLKLLRSPDKERRKSLQKN